MCISLFLQKAIAILTDENLKISNFKYRRFRIYVGPWAYTLVALICGLVHGDWLIHRGAYTRLLQKRKNVFQKLSDLPPLSYTFTMYFKDFLCKMGLYKVGPFFRNLMVSFVVLKYLCSIILNHG